MVPTLTSTYMESSLLLLDPLSQFSVHMLIQMAKYALEMLITLLVCFVEA